jgi:putative MATE family efflux protein
MNKHRLAEDNVKRLLLKLSLPAMTGMFVMALYNVVDTIFVGRGVGVYAVAGLSVVFPLQMIVMSIGMLFGIGGASLISRLLGKGNHARADFVYGNISVAAVLSGLILTVTGILFNDEILRLFGASPAILPISRDYYNIIILASPLFVTAMTGNNVLRSVGMARSAMTTMLTGAIANIILDPIFIFALKMGVKGAAWATVIAQALSVVFLLVRLQSPACSMRLKWKNLRLDAGLMREVTAIGFSSFIRNVSGSFVFALVNNKLLMYGNEVSVAAFGIAIKLSRFLAMPLVGIAQGLQPIIGYNYGAGRLNKVQEAAKTGLLYGSIFSLLGFVGAQVFARQLIGIFTEDSELLSAGEHAMRIMMLGMWVVGFQIVGTTIFQALGKAKEALLLSMSREVLFFIPIVMTLPLLFKLNGIWLTVPIADILSFLLTLIFIIRLRKKYAVLNGAGLKLPIITD